MSKHTPRPWKREGPYIVVPCHDRPGCNKRIARVYSDKTSMYVGEADENANALAAAPDLLAACKGLRAVIHDFLTHNEQTDCSVYIEAADAAIAKAEGGAQ